MSKTAEQKRVDHELRRLGFGGLDDPNLITSIAFFVRDHDHFRTQLFSVKPEQRQHAYNALRPHLRFTPKPLDVYEAEIKRLAEQRQLPTYHPITGELVEYKAGSVDLDLLATEAIRQKKHEDGGGVLELVCARCTVFKHFKAKLRKHAEAEAKRDGWRSDGSKNFCPQHVPTRLTMKMRCSNDDCLVEEQIRAWDSEDGYAAARVAGWSIGDAAVCPKCSMKKLIQ